MSETVKLIACTFLLTPLREGRPSAFTRRIRSTVYFYSRPCGRGDAHADGVAAVSEVISTHAPAGGATKRPCICPESRRPYFYSRPCGRGDRAGRAGIFRAAHFYSRPCGRGDERFQHRIPRRGPISTHAPAGGATRQSRMSLSRTIFLLTPLREGRLCFFWYSCSTSSRFLLTPLREGRRGHHGQQRRDLEISTHAPAGGATKAYNV